MSYSISTLLTRNLHDVFGENDPERRRAAIDEIFTEDCGGREDRGASREDSRRQSRARRLPGMPLLCVASATRRGRRRPGLPRRRQRTRATLPSSRTPQCFGVIFPAKVWVTIFPSFTTKVSVPIS
jgi:hypothetical protein